MPVTGPSPVLAVLPVLLVRHGRTAGNANGLVMGRRDLPLDEVGAAQVGALAAALSTRSIARVHTSPLRRARQTADALARACGAALVVEPELIELDFGVAAAAGPNGARPKLAVKANHLYDPLPGGESLHDVWLRLLRFFARLQPELEQRGAPGPVGAVAVVGHYRTNQLFEAMLRGQEFESAVGDSVYKPANAAVHEVCLATGRTSLIWQPR